MDYSVPTDRDSVRPGLPASIVSALRSAAVAFPHAVFLRFADGDRTYSAFDGESDLIANGLAAHGVSHGDVVSLFLPNRVEFVLAWLALAKLGAVTAPINTAFRGAMLADAINLAKGQLLIVDLGAWATIASVGHELTTLAKIIVVDSESSNDAEKGTSNPAWQAPPTVDWQDLISPQHPRVPQPILAGRDLAMLLYTSGTTGRSKAAMIPHQFIVTQAQGAIDGLGLREDDVLYCPYPLFHLDAAVMTVAPAVLLRAVAAIGARFSVSRFWGEMRAFEATVFDFMGATLTMLWKQPPSAGDKDHRARLGWGVPMPEWAPQFEQRFGCRLTELYGTTEVGAILYNPPDEPRRAGACGKAVGFVQVALHDERGLPVPTGSIGELVVRSRAPSVLTDGYWKMPQETLTTFRDQWFHTGDLLRQDVDDFFYFVGRNKDMVRRRGENIAAAEVELAIEKHPEVLACAVIGVPSELTEEEVLACVMLQPASALSPAALVDWCTQQMTAFMVPRYIRLMHELPRTPTDKIEKLQLRALDTRNAWDRLATDSEQ